MSGKTPPIRRKLVILRIPPIRPSADPPSADPFLCKILIRRAICRPKLPSTEPQELRRSEDPGELGPHGSRRPVVCAGWSPSSGSERQQRENGVVQIKTLLGQDIFATSGRVLIADSAQ